MKKRLKIILLQALVYYNENTHSYVGLCSVSPSFQPLWKIRLIRATLIFLVRIFVKVKKIQKFGVLPNRGVLLIYPIEKEGATRVGQRKIRIQFLIWLIYGSKFKKVLLEYKKILSDPSQPTSAFSATLCGCSNSFFGLWRKEIDRDIIVELAKFYVINNDINDYHVGRGFLFHLLGHTIEENREIRLNFLRWINEHES